MSLISILLLYDILSQFSTQYTLLVQQIVSPIYFTFQNQHSFFIMPGNEGRDSFVELEKQFNAMQAKLKRTKNRVDKHITKTLTEKWLLE